MRKAAFILLLALVSLFPTGKGQAQGTNGNNARMPLVNVGIKAGFNSSMFFIDHISVGGEQLEDVQNNYKVGYSGTFFCRFNLKRHHYIQTELSYNVSKGSVSIANTAENKELLLDNALIRTEIHSIDFPLLYGYKFVDINPYGMALFAGPKVAYNWDKHCKNEYEGFYQQDIAEKIRPFCFSLVAGVAVNVWNIFFDFRYEAGLHNMAESVSFDRLSTESPYNEQDIEIKRRRNVLSFSLGVIF